MTEVVCAPRLLIRGCHTLRTGGLYGELERWKLALSTVAGPPFAGRVCRRAGTVRAGEERGRYFRQWPIGSDGVFMLLPGLYGKVGLFHLPASLHRQ